MINELNILLWYFYIGNMTDGILQRGSIELLSYALCNPVLDNNVNLLYSRCKIPLSFDWLLVLSLYKEDYLQSFKCVSFWLHGFCGSWEGWAFVNRFNNTSGVTVVTPTDRPKSVCNRCTCITEDFGGVFCVVTLLFGIFCGWRGFLL